MDIYLHNTLTGKKELFTPITDGRVLMYNCGPTVYHYVHLGNLRSYIFADTLRRMFEYNKYEIKQVINITDVGHLVSDGDIGEDKMEKGAKREGKSAKEISEFYTQAFFDDLEKLNIEKANVSFPRATEYINEQKEMIQKLESEEYAYQTSDGIYFDTSKYPEYKNLFGIDRTRLDEEFARVIPVSGKKSHLDFALWKFSPKNEKREMEWQSKWGLGFPGWHIECSAMSKKLLGNTFDVHTGGIDHIPVHHTNEIAQSVCANHAPFVHYWMHNAFLTVGEDQKMAKSEENFLRLQSIIDRGIDPLAYRYLLLSARYSSPLQFSWEALEGAQTALEKLHDKVSFFDDGEKLRKNITDIYENKFQSYINDDLNTPQALAFLWEIVKDENLSQDEKKYLILKFDKVLGLGLDQKSEVLIPEKIKHLVEIRNKARTEKDFAKSDELRTEIEKEGFEVMDTPEGTKIL